MTFKSFLDTPCGIRYMFDTLSLQSPCGRKALLESKIMRDIKEIEKSYEVLGEIYGFFVCGNGEDGILGGGYTVEGSRLIEKLHCLRDISGTVSRLAEGAVLDDIELFEIKYLALISEDVRGILLNSGLRGVVLPVLVDVVEILDPEGLRISSFYVYDSYSEKLRGIRGRIKEINAVLEKIDRHSQEDGTEVLQNELQELFIRMNELEGEIRAELSEKLGQYARDIYIALRDLSGLDVLLAKAMQIKRMGLCFPHISRDCATVYRNMFHPQIKEVLKESGKEFTPVDIEFSLEPVTIIGANMGGKTVVLKMAALNQLLFQFGFGIPASDACIDIKDSVMLCTGDEQNELAGLSSFAGEMKVVNNILKRVKRGERLLALIDEPARTTNPVEGTALVSALLRVLYKKEVSVLLTTHYNIEGDFYRRLRVKGLCCGVMDYRLEEVLCGRIPHEAIGIAESLGIDKEWIGEAKKVLREKV